ncbi:polysaccharide biosynthesis C-terminal domain-containing protein [Methanobrevibacter arboriphilus]|uniref:polysaccharide biosynthesis C-terminal domain-containing protein n=1 Tax=Methanobrevibacter arboriphilus TaxID=39441 RepID=UPI000B06407C|nr:polysaccharide biosynthesis C-terminal domain-containing protein [Methanobrevibacter arboriphilus]
MFNIIAVPFIGIIGAAIVTLFCYFIALLITVFYSRKYLELPYDYISMIKIAISSIIMGIVVAIINPNGIWNVLITIIIGIVVYLLVLFLIKGINKEELNFF